MATEPAKKAPAKKAAVKNAKGFEETLWDAANKLRGSVESSEYKHIVLSLIFLKFISDKFEARRQEMMDEGQGDYVDMVEFYTMKNVFYLPETSRWSHILKHAKQDDIAVRIDTALMPSRRTTPRCAVPCRTTTFPAWDWMPPSWPRWSIPSTTSKRWPTNAT
jgi:type I restriction enzyme M protein